jgi:hypothetical protein
MQHVSGTTLRQRYVLLVRKVTWLRQTQLYSKPCSATVVQYAEQHAMCIGKTVHE